MSTTPSRKAYVVGGADHYLNWTGFTPCKTMEEADLVVWSGGADVGPYLYGEARHCLTHCDYERDDYEVKMYERARALNKPMLGICRGAQLLGVLNGCKLVQDQQNHRYIHPIQTHDGQRILMTSMHHQAVWPWGLAPDRFKVLAWTKGLSLYHDGAEFNVDIVIGTAPDDIEVEGIYFPETRAFGIQGHPEALITAFEEGQEEAIKTITWCREQLNRLMDGSLGVETAIVADHA